MYLIDANMLELGDILLTKAKRKNSIVIRTVTLSSVSHAMLYVGTLSIIHALTDEGVRPDNPQRILFESRDDVTCMRLKDSTNSRIVIDVCNYVRSQSWKSYSKTEAAKTRIPFRIEDNSNRQFCSRLIAEAYRQAGVELVENSAYCTPEDIRRSSELEVIPDVLREASDKEVEFVLSDSPLDEQAKVNKEILSYVRQITGEDLQTELQVIEYLKVNREHDEAITNKYRSSGYFEFWKNEMRMNPWRYDPVLFLASFSEEEIVGVAKFEVQEAQKNTVIYKESKDRFMALYDDTGLLIVKEMVKLCDALMMMNIKRYEACVGVLG